ncbi:pyridoxal phosphate homeostasis protein [Tetranychus urticae]|uniref:pyridoxal phosphate homeostasis protein n=1 Tax=Tetranychus urticae TaxID=32264 RepID=UPI00077BA166|nr:pyridoxal phosphate homeostasis protein [Tetranychus urticae]XP_015786157.1 pyridoxal phosphate homeostasis protein [Tetranychus urticae]
MIRAMGDIPISLSATQVLSKIKQACDKRKEAFKNINVRLVAVSKTKPKSAIIEAYNCGLRYFGENYVNELSEKSHDPEVIEKCPDIKWHFIGRVQKKQINKLLATRNLSIWETVDSQVVADLANGSLERNFAGKKVSVMVQVNTSDEPNKAGIEPENVNNLVEHIISKCPHLELVGLMTIGSINHSLGEGLNPDFERLEKCKQEVCRKFDFDADKFELSMGMSSDFETAILMGSSNVRVGSTIFGQREYKK